MNNKIIITMLTCVLACGAGLFSFVYAAKADNKPPYSVQDELTRAECGDCHMVFPPSRLTMGGWKKIMSTLPNHFGEDASLVPEKVKHIEAYLVANALDASGSYPSKLMVKQWKKKGLVDPIRITDTPNWKRHHTAKKKYKRMAEEIGYTRGSNCIKCHKDAEHGIYEEFPGLYGEH